MVDFVCVCVDMDDVFLTFCLDNVMFVLIFFYCNMVFCVILLAF